MKADFGNPTWVLEDAPDFCYEHKNDARCENVRGQYEYDVSLGANIAFLAIFFASLLGFIVTYGFTRRGLAFTIALSLGLICEVLGYGGRIMGAQNKWDSNGFLIQICCLTIGPAFMAAGLYLCLRRIVAVFGAENSRIRPEMYTRIFIPCDVIALVFQALGGALASIASQNHESVDLGSNIMIAGLSFQVATVLCFIIASTDFAFRLRRRYQQHGESIFPQDPALRAMRSSFRFKAFLGALGLSSFLILWRSVFRVAELSQGWDGELMTHQELFIAFEGVLIVVAVLVLNVFHPAFCSKELLAGGGGMGGLWLFRRKGKKAKGAEKESDPLSSESSQYKSPANSQTTSVHEGYPAHGQTNATYSDRV